MTQALLFIAGGALLVAGAELLVRGSARLAARIGMSPLVIGLTVVAFGTSAPELAVTVGAAVNGQTQLAAGNVVGSNIFNVLLILGISAAVAPLVVSSQLVRFDVPLMIVVSVAVLVLALDGTLGRLDGILLVLGGVAYTTFLVRSGSSGERDAEAEPGDAAGPGPGPPPRLPQWVVDGLGIVGGLVALVLGSRWFVSAAVDTAASLGVSELVIGLTIVAGGTSLPELATSVLASIRGQRDIAVGNVVGSNLFNLLVVLGLGSIVAPDGIGIPAGALTFDFPVMIAVAVATLPVFFTGYRLSRWEGGVFVAYYAAYTVYLILHASGHHAVDELRAAILYFALPLTVLTLGVLVVRAVKEQPAGQAEG